MFSVKWHCHFSAHPLRMEATLLFNINLKSVMFLVIPAVLSSVNHKGRKGESIIYPDVQNVFLCHSLESSFYKLAMFSRWKTI